MHCWWGASACARAVLGLRAQCGEAQQKQQTCQGLLRLLLRCLQGSIRLLQVLPPLGAALQRAAAHPCICTGRRPPRQR